jgi:hypothetical protein
LWCLTFVNGGRPGLCQGPPPWFRKPNEAPMLIVVRRDDHQLAVINTEMLVQVVWRKSEAEYTHWSVQMSHGREVTILTPISRITVPTTAAGTTIGPEQLLTTLAGGLAA